MGTMNAMWLKVCVAIQELAVRQPVEVGASNALLGEYVMPTCKFISEACTAKYRSKCHAAKLRSSWACWLQRVK